MLATIGLILLALVILGATGFALVHCVLSDIEFQRKEDMMDKVRMAALSDELARDREVRSWKYINE